MKAGILLIVGPTQSGKTWLANAIRSSMVDGDCVIWDEPSLKHGKKCCKGAIKKFAKVGLAVITTSGNGWEYADQLIINKTIYARDGFDFNV